MEKTYSGSGGVEAGRSITKLRAEQIHSEDSFTSLAVDLEALRGQVKDIIGAANYKEEITGSYANVQIVDLAAHLDASSANPSLSVKQAANVVGGFSVNTNKFSVAAASGNTLVAGTLGVSGTATLASAVVSDLTPGRVVFVGTGDALVDDADFVFDSTSATNALKVTGEISGSAALKSGGTLDVAGNSALAGTLTVSSTSLFNDNVTIASGKSLTVGGDLIINGTTTTVNSTTLTVDDKNIELGSTTSPTDATADGGGITLKGDTDHTILWSNSQDAWEFSEHLVPAGTKDLGLTGDRWQNLWLAGAADIDGALDVAGASALGGTLSVAGASTLTGLLDAKGGAVVTGSLKIEGDVAQRLYIVGSSNEIKDEALLTFDGSELRVAAAFEATGAAVLGSTLEVTGEADFLGALDVAGQSFFADHINLDKAAHQSILKTGGALVMSGSSDLRFAAGAAVKFVDVNRESSTWSSSQGIQLSSSPSSWSNFEAAFGEVSLLDAIASAGTGSGGGRGKWKKIVGSAGTSVTFVGGDQVGGTSVAPSFPADAGRSDIFLNGQLMAAEDVSVSGAVATFTFNVQANDVVVAVIR